MQQSPYGQQGMGPPATIPMTAVTRQMQGLGLGPPPSQFGHHWYARYLSQIDQATLMQLNQWFQQVDKDHSGSISPSELGKMVIPGQGGWGGKPLGISNARKLIKLVDRDHSGTCDFYEYAALFGFVNQMQMAFWNADTDRSGKLDAREIHGALQQAGFMLSFRSVQVVFKKFASGGFMGVGAGLDFVTFMLMCADIAHNRSLFEMADRDRDGKISFDELLEISAALTASSKSSTSKTANRRNKQGDCQQQ